MGTERPATLHDVAREAGVSINTASRALNNKPYVSEATRKLVLKVARELDYRPNHLARSLRQSRTSTIGVVISDIVNPFFAEVVEGIEREAAARGYGIVLANIGHDASREMQVVQTLVDRQVDGVLISPSQPDPDSIEYLINRGVPYCLLGRVFERIPGPAVINDDRAGARMAVEYLLSRGHRRILFLNAAAYSSQARRRLEGYIDAHRQAGLPVDPGLILETDARMHGGYVAMQQAFTNKAGFTAVFCFNDFVSFGVVQALRDAGLRIPDDVAVMGYDDVMVSQVVDPPLSTVRIAKTRLGQTACQLLIRILESGPQRRRKQEDKQMIDQDTQHTPIVLPPELVIRRSA